MLVDNKYVTVVCLDFSKAFDTVRHCTLAAKLATLDIPDPVYNWIIHFLTDCSHCTDLNGERSAFAKITASIVQGSGIGPVAYMVTAGDLCPVNAGNKMSKFADDTYLIVPANSIESRAQELVHVKEWAICNNLQLNRSKTVEIIFTDARRLQKYQEPPLLAGIERVKSIKVLGVTFTDKLSMTPHLNNVLGSCSQTLYALKVLRANGMNDIALQTIYKATILAKLHYATSAWWGILQLPTDSESTTSSNAVSSMASVHLRQRNLQNSALTLIKSCFGQY